MGLITLVATALIAVIAWILDGRVRRSKQTDDAYKAREQWEED